MRCPEVETTLPKPLRIGFLTSYRGTDMRAIVETIATGELDAIPAVVISNNTQAQNKNATALRYAQSESPIPFDAVHISRQSDGVAKTDEEVDELLARTLIEHDVDAVLCCGYMKKIGPHTLRAFEGRIFNVHPALLPDFEALWGDTIYDAVLDRRRSKPEDPITQAIGPTVHLVNGEYDQGEVVSQVCLYPPLLEGDTIENIKPRMQGLEKILYIHLVRDICARIYRLPQRRHA